MRVAILGGGTAGYMAAAHLTQRCPGVELLHIHDPSLPVIGVGEGSTPGFAKWLQSLPGVAPNEIPEGLDATEKKGIHFDGWGRNLGSFPFDFLPTTRLSWHLSAPGLVNFLKARTRTTELHMRVERVDDVDGGVEVQLAGGDSYRADAVVDARGFPRELDERHRELTWIPTDSATVTRGPPVRGQTHSGAVARPHGWVFSVPLQSHTAYGYVFAKKFSEDEQVEQDFREFLAAQGVAITQPPRVLRFPNFVARTIFDGRTLRLGNAASFVEPLHATSIAIVLRELEMFRIWLQLFSGPAELSMRAAAALNDEIHRLVVETSVFIGWHFSEGSRFDTPFWRGAARGFDEGLANDVPESIARAFQEQLLLARQVGTDALSGLRAGGDPAAFLRLPQDYRPFGGMSPIGFAQVMQGLAAMGGEA